MVQKTKNALRAFYDESKDKYGGIVTAWKADFVSDADYQAFMRTYSYLPLPEVPEKYHRKIAILKNMISIHLDLLNKYKVEENSKQLALPML